MPNSGAIAWLGGNPQTGRQLARNLSGRSVNGYTCKVTKTEDEAFAIEFKHASRPTLIISAKTDTSDGWVTELRPEQAYTQVRAGAYIPKTSPETNIFYEQRNVTEALCQSAFTAALQVVRIILCTKESATA